MSIPDGWAEATLGETLPLSYGKALPEAQRRAGTVPVYGSSGVVGSHDAAFTSGPTIVVGRKGNVGQPHLCNQPCWPIDTVYFSEAKAGTDLRFFLLLLEFKELRRLDRSTAVPGLSRNDYDAVTVSLPPTSEQLRIVEALDSYLSRLDDAVASLERAQAKLKAYRASVLKAAVEGRLVPTEAELARQEGRSFEPASVLLERIRLERRRRWEEAELARLQRAGKPPRDDRWKEKYEEPQPPDTSKLPRLPEGWCWASVGQLASDDAYALCDGPFGSNLKSEHYTESGPRVVRLQNIGDGEFLDAVAHIAISHFQSLHRHQVYAEDLVVASLGVEVPRVAPVPVWLGPAIVKADCLRFSVDRRIAHPRYVMHTLNSPPTRQRVGEIVHGIGRPRIGLTLFRQAAVPLVPLSEQARIADEIDRLLSMAGQIGADVERELTRISRLRQSILKWAFEGRLVDQDPSDEPAEKLLARIRAERASATPQKKTRARKAGADE